MRTSSNKKQIIRDFHLHTIYSDGLYYPEKLVEEAAKQGVNELAITDHDSIAELHAGFESAKKSGITMVSGVEMTAKYRGKEIHVLGYGFNHIRVSGFPLFKYMKEIKEFNDRWISEIINLSQKQPILLDRGNNKAEIYLTEKDIGKFSEASKPTEFHLSLLVKEKLESLSPQFTDVPARHIFYFLFRRKEPQYFEKYAPLFAEYGIENKKYWSVPRAEGPFLPVDNVISMLLEAGALPIIAHPGEMSLLEQELNEITGMGIRGVEVYTPKHSPEQTGYYESITAKLGLCRTGGSDFHDPDHRNEVKIGRGKKGEKLTKGISAQDICVMQNNF